MRLNTHSAHCINSLPPDGLSISSTTTSLTISWALVEGVTATSYSISYSATDTDCIPGSNTIPPIPGSETMYILPGLEEGTEYSITVTATITEEDGGGTQQYTIIETTMAAGENSLSASISDYISLSQLPLPLPLL